MAVNPFTLIFEKEPYITIGRGHLISDVVADFGKALPKSQIYIYIGARGVGKSHCSLNYTITSTERTIGFPST